MHDLRGALFQPRHARLSEPYSVRLTSFAPVFFLFLPVHTLTPSLSCNCRSASCAVQPANIPRIRISDDPRNMRIVELESESDGNSSDDDDDDDDDDDGMKSESEDEDEDEGARANNRRIIYNCIKYDSDNDEDLPLDKVHMVEARRVPAYEHLYEPEAVEDVLDAYPFIKENPGIWFRVVPHFVFSYDDENDRLKIMARPPLGMFNFDD